MAETCQLIGARRQSHRAGREHYGASLSLAGFHRPANTPRRYVELARKALYNLTSLCVAEDSKSGLQEESRGNTIEGTRACNYVELARNLTTIAPLYRHSYI